MDSFEQVVSEILWMQGYRVRTSVKVNLTAADKREIGRPSSPRWELDIVAYSGRENLLRIVEGKSYLDSTGVQSTGFEGGTEADQRRYKLFNDQTLRRVVFHRLSTQLAECGACSENADVRLCLAAGKIRERDRSWLRKHFKDQRWDLWDEDWLRKQLEVMSKQGYETFRATAAQARHLCRRASLVDEDQSVRLTPHGWLSFGHPFGARLADVGSILFARPQRFF